MESDPPFSAAFVKISGKFGITVYIIDDNDLSRRFLRMRKEACQTLLNRPEITTNRDDNIDNWFFS